VETPPVPEQRPVHGQGTWCIPCCIAPGGGRRTGPDLATAPNLTDPTAIITAMWNHAEGMENKLRRSGTIWPQFAPGEVADLSAFLLTKRGWVPPSAVQKAGAAGK
jgi:hypothetical protein